MNQIKRGIDTINIQRSLNQFSDLIKGNEGSAKQISKQSKVLNQSYQQQLTPGR